MKIIILGAFKYPVGEAASSYLRRLAFGLQNTGASVTILTIGPDLSCRIDKALRPSKLDCIPYHSCISERPLGRKAKAVAAVKGIASARNFIHGAAKVEKIDALILYSASALL